MDMCMRYVDTDDLLANIRHIECLAKVKREFFDGTLKRLIGLCIEIPDELDLYLRYDECVTRGNRVNIEEGVDYLIFVDFV